MIGICGEDGLWLPSSVYSTELEVIDGMNLDQSAVTGYSDERITPVPLLALFLLFTGK